MTRPIRTTFTFPVGYHEFHKEQLFNFQLNRWHSFGYGRFQDMQEAGRRINSFGAWKTEMARQAVAALADNRLMNAAFYYRAAEFYLSSSEPDKSALYDRFIDLFNEAFRTDGIERHLVPYGSGGLPVMRLAPTAAVNHGTIVLHGGFDSFIEEFYSWMWFFSQRGYEVIAFEGPGQGAARRKHGLAFDYRWELPTGAVLDYFGLKEVTLLGVSMGGYLCLRAAALDTRVKRVVASSIAYDYMKFQSPLNQLIGRFFFSHLRAFSNWAALQKMNRDEMHRWSIGNLMYMTDTATPMDAMDVAMRLNAKNLLSSMVEQDVLILTGSEDHFVPFKMHGMQLRALTHARSVTGKVFGTDQSAQNHCQIGNVGLALQVMVDWIAAREDSQNGSQIYDPSNTTA
ncbi:MAG: alpha/beta fold hydrolase [Dehalococcoidia bacterium]|nr:alpha/beta fold hydrolase [Dehalococcoidia bacterium]